MGIKLKGIIISTCSKIRPKVILIVIMIVKLKFLSEKTKHICFKLHIILDIWNSDHKARLIAKIKRREVELESILSVAHARFLVSPAQAASSTGVLRIPAGLLKGLYFLSVLTYSICLS